MQLPDGGQLIVPMHRLVALYGHPGTPSLGALGEQGISASVTRIKKLAASYQALSKSPVVPAFEIITTLATSAAGPTGDYSYATPVATLRPWIRAATKAGMYVILDLQPGRDSFLQQAKAYQSLLELPNVGLALDPEWALKSNQLSAAADRQRQHHGGEQRRRLAGPAHRGIPPSAEGPGAP